MAWLTKFLLAWFYEFDHLVCGPQNGGPQALAYIQREKQSGVGFDFILSVHSKEAKLVYILDIENYQTTSYKFVSSSLTCYK